jgi:hypothetical protein
MQTGGQERLKRCVRIGAITLAIMGALAVGHERARAQIGVDILRQAVDTVKDKGKNITDLVKGKKKKRADDVKDRLKGKLDKSARDKLKDRLGKDRLKDKDRLTKDRLKDGAKDRLTKDGLKDRLPKDRLTKDGVGKDKSVRDRLKDKRFTKDKDGVKDKAAKDKGIGRNKGKDKSIAKDKDTAKDKLARDKKDGKDRSLANEKGKDKGTGKGKDKALAREKGGTDKAGKAKTAFDKSGKGRRDVLSSTKAKAVPDRRAIHRFARAKSPVERGKLRINHLRDINAARLRLPPRPFPGTPKFTGVPPVGETRFVSSEMVFHVAPNVSRATAEAAAKRHGMVIVAERRSSITGGTLYICRIPAGVQVATAVRAMEGERIGIAAPEYVYRIVQDTAADTSAPGSPEQYVIEKLQLAEVHKAATGKGILVAVIDSKVDAGHPDIAHAIAEQHDADELT